MAKKATVTNKGNQSEAIRDALKKLGIDSPVKEIAAEICKVSPVSSKRIEAIGDDWDNYVSGQRRKLREGGSTKPKYSSPDRVTIGNLLEIGKIKAKLKKPDDLAEIVRLVINLGSPEKLEMILKKHAELMAKYGDDKKISEFLTTVQ